MGYANNRITLPYTLQDACDALDYQTDELKTLFENGSVAMWAKYKPMEFSLNGAAYGFALTDANRLSANWGIGNIPTWTAKMLVHMAYFWFGLRRASYPTNYPDIGLKDSYWTYARPTTAFRMSDLIANPAVSGSLGYYRGARPPLGNITASTVYISPGGNLTFIFAKNEEGVSDGLTVRYEDLQLNSYSVYNMYFGFALFRKNTNPEEFLALTQNSTMVSFQAMGASVHTHTEDAGMEGSYKIFPFASADRIQGTQYSSDVYEMTDDLDVNSNYIALAEPEDVDIVVRYADVRVLTLTSYRDASNSNIIRNLWSVHNYMTDYPVTITKMTLEYIETDGATVTYTQDILTAVNVDSGDTESGQSDHNFGSSGTANIGYVRMTIVTLQGVVFYHSNISVKVVEVGDDPTPE